MNQIHHGSLFYVLMFIRNQFFVFVNQFSFCCFNSNLLLKLFLRIKGTQWLLQSHLIDHTMKHELHNLYLDIMLSPFSKRDLLFYLLYLINSILKFKNTFFYLILKQLRLKLYNTKYEKKKVEPILHLLMLLVISNITFIKSIIKIQTSFIMSSIGRNLIVEIITSDQMSDTSEFINQIKI